MNVLVTGATGHLGANIVAHLNRAGIRPRVLMRGTSSTAAIGDLDYRPVLGDVTDYGSVSAAVEGVQVVYHAAAMVSFLRRKLEQMKRVNVGGTRNVIRACLEHGVDRLVHTSSVAAVAHTPSRTAPVDERAEWNFDPRMSYAFTKHLSELAVREAAATDKLSAVIINPALIFGERDVNLNAGKLLVQIQRGWMLVTSPGTQAVCDADDVAAAHLAAAERGRDGARYIVATASMSYRSLFRQIAGRVGGRPPLLVMPAPLVRGAGWIAETVAAPLLGREPALTWELGVQGTLHGCFDGSRAKRELGIRYTPFHETLDKTRRWLEDNGHMCG